MFESAIIFFFYQRLLTKPSLCHSILNEMNTTLDLWYDLESNYLRTSKSIMLIMFCTVVYLFWARFRHQTRRILRTTTQERSVSLIYENINLYPQLIQNNLEYLLQSASPRKLILFLLTFCNANERSSPCKPTLNISVEQLNFQNVPL